MIPIDTHPAESPEFLSRLHDGELDADEASAFEAHRAKCPDCRSAAAEFERALSAYREAPVAPVASDLSVRILRKVRATSPSRRPFGVTFGIDFRWAGILAAALLLVIIGAPVFSRRAAAPERAASGDAGPISAYVVHSDEVGATAKKAESAPAPKLRAAAPKPALPAGPGEPPASGRKDAPATFAAEPDAGRDNAAGRSDAVSAAPAAPPPALGKSAVAPAPAPGLRARRHSASAPAAAEEEVSGSMAPAEARLTIRAADGDAPAPGLVRKPAAGRLAALRGQEFVLTVERDGRVLAVATPEAEDKLSRERPAGTQAMPAPAESPEVILRELVFQPGDRVRRLTITVE